MTRPLRLNPNRFFPAEPIQRQIAGELFASVSSLPIISPHGHTDPAWFAGDAPFATRPPLLLAGPLSVPHAVQPGRVARGASA